MTDSITEDLTANAAASVAAASSEARTPTASAVEIANAVQAHGAERAAALKADDRLSAAYRDELLEANRVAVRAELERLAAEDRADLLARQSEVQRVLSTPEPAVSGAQRATIDISYRDALDRAAQAAHAERPGELARLAERARRTGDSLLERAAFATAMDVGDSEVIAMWTAAHPEASGFLEELSLIGKALSTGAFIRRANFEFSA